MKIYLAGPMRGNPESNVTAFYAAAAKLRAEGHEVFSPAEESVKEFGESIFNATGDEDKAEREHPGYSRRRAMASNLDWICRHAEAIALLPGWELSTGSQAERHTALAIGLSVILL